MDYFDQSDLKRDEAEFAEYERDLGEGFVGSFVQWLQERFQERERVGLASTLPAPPDDSEEIPF